MGTQEHSNWILKTFFVAFALVAGIGVPLHGQVQDAGMWLSASGEVKLNPVWTVVLSEELRLVDNMRVPSTSFTELDVEYNIGSAWRISAQYRIIGRLGDANGWTTAHRISGDLRYRLKLAHGDVIARLRFQHQDGLGWFFDQFCDVSQKIRPEVTLRWRASPQWRPYLSAEIFCPIYAGGVTFPDKWRIKGGALYQMNKRHVLDIYYMVQHEFNVREPETDFVIGIGYRFSPRGLRLRTFDQKI